MDTNQETNQEEFQDLENVENIDERVLNTPAEEQKVTLPKIDEGQQMETFLQFNRTPQVQTEGGIVLDLAGEQAEIEEEDLSAETNTKLLRKITGEEGSEIPVNEIIGYIGEKNEEVTEDGAASGPNAGRSASGQISDPSGVGPEIKADRQQKKLFISPLARKTAKEMGINYESVTIKGTGPGGRITKDDIVALCCF